MEKTQLCPYPQDAAQKDIFACKHCDLVHSTAPSIPTSAFISSAQPLPCASFAARQDLWKLYFCAHFPWVEIEAKPQLLGERAE